MYVKVWSSSEYSNNNAWNFCTDSNLGAKQGGVNNNNKDNTNKHVVRPVLAFLMKPI